FPEPVVILVRMPVTFHVRGDKFVCQILNVSDRVVSAENVTALSFADQQTGRGTLGIDAWDPESGADSKALRRSPARVNAAYAPVLSAGLPSIGASHQSTAELSKALADE